MPKLTANHTFAVHAALEEAGCRVETFLKLVSQEWVSHIIYALATRGDQQFGALRRALPGVSARVLSSKLKHLEALGHVSRTEGRKGRVRTVAYSLTDDGRALDFVLRSTERTLSGNQR